MCVIVKQENLYLKEFVTYYKNLGIKKIFLYDNNDKFGENMYEILKKEINSKFVKIVNVRGRSYIQLSSYNHCYHKHLYSFLWFLFVDVDEYLYIKKNCSLNAFINNKKFEKCENIHINYKDYGDSDLIKYDNRSIIKKFTKNFRNIASMKTFVRGGIKNAIMDIHRSKNIKNYCDSEGQIINPGQYFTPKIVIDSAEIKHYITKSTEEFYERLLKGWPSIKYKSLEYQYFVESRISNYFEINKINQKKFDILSPLIKDKKLLIKLKEKIKKENIKYKIWKNFRR